jgi:hypothetical protein
MVLFDLQKTCPISMDFCWYSQRKYDSARNHAGIEYRDIINGLIVANGDYENTHEYIAAEMAKGDEDYQATGSVLLKLYMWSLMKDEDHKIIEEFLKKCKNDWEFYGIMAGAQYMKKDTIYEFCQRSISDYKSLTNDGGTLSWMFADTMKYYCIVDRAEMWRMAGRCKEANRARNDPYHVSNLGEGFFLIPPKMRAMLLLLNRRHIRDEEYSKISTEDILELYEDYAKRETKKTEIVERLKRDGRLM